MKIRILSQEDEKSLDDLIYEIENSLIDKTWWLPIKKEEKKHYFNPQKILFFGGFIDGKLIGASALFLDVNDYSDLISYLDINKDEVLKIGRSMVHPDYRGMNRMHKINDYILNYAKKYNKKHFIAIAHPENIASNKSLHKTGFRVEKTIIKDEKYLRNIFLLELRSFKKREN